MGTGLVPPGTDWSRIHDRVQPDVALRETYDELYEVYRELYPATREQLHRLAAVQEQTAVTDAPSEPLQSTPGR
jgi:xylulokinase